MATRYPQVLEFWSATDLVETSESLKRSESVPCLFFKKANDLIYCFDIKGLMNELEFSYRVDCLLTQNCLKAALLFNGIEKLSVSMDHGICIYERNVGEHI